MTLCSSHPQQADFGARPSFQATTCFVSKIRDADRWTQKREDECQLILSVNTAGEITNVFFHTVSFLPPASWASSLPHPLLLPSTLHSLLASSSFSCFLRSIPLHHAPSVFVSLRHSFPIHALHFNDSPVSPRQINPKNLSLSRCCLIYNYAMSEKNIIKDS